MKRSTIRVVLYFPGDHPVGQYPDKNRNAVVKALVEQALTSNNILGEMQKDIKEIKRMLSSGIPCNTDNNSGIKPSLSDSDIALIDQMLGKS